MHIRVGVGGWAAIEVVSAAAARWGRIGDRGGCTPSGPLVSFEPSGCKYQHAFSNLKSGKYRQGIVFADASPRWSTSSRPRLLLTVRMAIRPRLGLAGHLNLSVSRLGLWQPLTRLRIASGWGSPGYHSGITLFCGGGGGTPFGVGGFHKGGGGAGTSRLGAATNSGWSKRSDRVRKRCYFNVFYSLK
jgi:hypothetical protein